jgi:tetratricopeptide (TPR) repeat protein
MARAYRLYDEGINARIAGDNGLAVSKLTESWKLFNDTRAYQRTGESSLNEALVHYELGQAAEGAGDYLTARDSYMRCLNIRPTFVDASVKLVNLLAMSGQWQMALAKAKDAARNNPNDARVHQLMALTLSKSGHPEEARHEAHKAQECLKYVPNYKPMGIDAVWKRTHHEDGTVKSGTSDSGSLSEPSEGETESHGDTGKSDVDNPEDVMGVQEEPEEEE